ncbi:MAG TPA: hypothetical protein VFV02_02330 [Acidimicrobiales bacterium]|nr:hypothetical protein [Acidimicrobiales bacterium]
MSDRYGAADETGADIPDDGSPPPGDAGLKPSTMRGSEFRYALGVAVILLVVAVLNFAIRHGKGAPKHPSTGLALVGLAAALAVFPLLRTKNRFIVPFGAVIAAFFVTLPSGPTSLKSLHVLAIIFPLAFALVLTQRQRKAALADARSRAASRSSGPAGSTRPQRSRRRKKEEEPSGPTANRRYTPPKPKRARR